MCGMQDIQAEAQTIRVNMRVDEGVRCVEVLDVRLFAV